MMIPIRCFECNNILGNRAMIWREYKERLKDPKNASKELTEEEMLKKLDLHKWCCKKNVTTHYDIEYDTKNI